MHGPQSNQSARAASPPPRDQAYCPNRAPDLGAQNPLLLTKHHSAFALAGHECLRYSGGCWDVGLIGEARFISESHFSPSSAELHLCSSTINFVYSYLSLRQLCGGVILSSILQCRAQFWVDCVRSVGN
eukprot:Gb_10085 [translate_table: standard]